MQSEATVTSPVEALERTDRALRRLLRQIRDAEIGLNEEMDTEIRRARRQLRANQMVLDPARAASATE
jgi:hypothetical protein